MKQKLSVTLDEELIGKMAGNLSTGKFRNKSHLVEYAVKKLLAEQHQSMDAKLKTQLAKSEEQDG